MKCALDVYLGVGRGNVIAGTILCAMAVAISATTTATIATSSKLPSMKPCPPLHPCLNSDKEREREVGTNEGKTNKNDNDQRLTPSGDNNNNNICHKLK
mgnify:CR=1 FL=1